MPYNKKNRQTWVKITVYFHSGTKVYNMGVDKKRDFLKKLRLRNDVIKYTSETIHHFIT